MRSARCASSCSSPQRGWLRRRCLAATLFRLGKIKFAVFALILAAAVSVTAVFWPKYTAAVIEARLSAEGYSDIALCTTLDSGSILRPDGCRQRLLADLCDGSSKFWT